MQCPDRFLVLTSERLNVRAPSLLAGNEALWARHLTSRSRSRGPGRVTVYVQTSTVGCINSSDHPSAAHRSPCPTRVGENLRDPCRPAREPEAEASGPPIKVKSFSTTLEK